MEQFPVVVGTFYPAEGTAHSIVTVAEPEQAAAMKGARVAIVREQELKRIMSQFAKPSSGAERDNLDYSFAWSDAWRKVLNYEQRAKKIGCMGVHCGDGENCTGDIIVHKVLWAPVGVPVCWHHANLMDRDRFGIDALVKDGLANRIARKVVRECVSSHNREKLVYVNASSIAWFAARTGLLKLLPDAFLIAAGVHVAETTKFVGHGYRETAARYSTHPSEGIQAAVDKAIKALEVDPETPNALLGIPKLKTFQCEKYLKWVRTLPCAVTGREGVEAHHLIDVLGGTMGGKTHDLFTIPLSHEQHRLLHHDRKAWEKRNGPQWYHVLKTIDKALALGVLQ